MTEASKKRMEEACEKHGDEYQVRETEEWTGNAVFRFKDLDSSFCAGYKAGMQDPDAGKLSIEDYLGLYERIGRALKDTGVPLTTHEMAEMRNVIRSHAKVNDENKRLMEALEYYANEESWRESEAYAERLTICGDERLLKGHYLVGGRRATKALSSGGE